MVSTWEQLAAGLAQLPRSTVLHGATRPLSPRHVAAKVTRHRYRRSSRNDAALAALAAGRWERIVYAVAALEEVSPAARRGGPDPCPLRAAPGPSRGTIAQPAPPQTRPGGHCRRRPAARAGLGR